ncbi:MAG: hypothetical protein Q4G43_07255 [Mobilicoccus sp.]|nr:hypothetical protein [Mobilicoccus sp.]
MSSTHSDSHHDDIRTGDGDDARTAHDEARAGTSDTPTSNDPTTETKAPDASRSERDFDDRADDVEERLDRLEGDESRRDDTDRTRTTDTDRVSEDRRDADRGAEERRDAEAVEGQTFRAERPEDLRGNSEGRDADRTDRDNRSTTDERRVEESRDGDRREGDHRDDERRNDERRTDESVGVERSEHTAGEERADTAVNTGEQDGEDQSDEDAREAEEARRRAEEFAREHDPANHDISAGEEFRQRGDIVVDGDRAKVMDDDGQYRDAGDPQAVAEGTVIPGEATDAGHEGGHDHGGDQDHDGGGDAQAASDGRRVSEYDEVRDGGYGVGSACPIDDGAMPLGHPVKAWNDTMSYVDSDHGRYADAEPHVWFTDADAAQRAGFHRAGD